MRLEIGPGYHPSIAGEDVIYIDRKALPYPRAIVRDLQELPLPFPDNYFDEIHAYQVLEHVPALGPLMDELHRLLKPDGLLMLGVPHIRFEYRVGPWIDHVHHFSENTFRMLETDTCTKQWKVVCMNTHRERLLAYEITKPGRILKDVRLRRLAWCVLNFWKLNREISLYVELRPNKPGLDMQPFNIAHRCEEGGWGR